MIDNEGGGTVSEGSCPSPNINGENRAKHGLATY